jgi:hypothetical protein
MRIPTKVRTMTNRDGAVVMDIRAGSMFSLNPIASIIWKQLGEDRSLEEIAMRLAADFRIPHEQARTDVNEFVRQLEVRQLLLVSGDDHSSKTRPPGLKGFLRSLLRLPSSADSTGPQAGKGETCG